MNISDVATTTDFEVVSNYKEDLWQWIAYIVEGVIMFSTNIVLFSVFVKYEALRREKEYIFVAGLALADALNGFAYIAAGVHRTVVTVMETYNDKVSSWRCMMTVHNFVWVFADPMATVMLLIISVDRILSGVFLVRYISWRRYYAFMFVSLGYAYAFAFGVWALVASWQEPADRRYALACWLWTTSPMIPHQYTAGTVCVTASVAGYFIVWLLYQRYFKRAQIGTWGRELQQRAKKQRQITISMGISNLFTFLFCVIPYGIISYVSVAMPNSSLQSFIIIALFIVYNVNPMLNVIIYVKRQKEIHIGIKGLLSCKEMPANVRTWNVTGV